MSVRRSSPSSPTYRYLAEDALELIDIEYDPLGAVTDPECRLLRRTRRSCTRGPRPTS